MPCYSGQDSGGADYELREKLKKTEAILCGLIRSLTNTQPGGDEAWIKYVNWKEVGISQDDALHWWREHVKIDHIRNDTQTRREF